MAGHLKPMWSKEDMKDVQTHRHMYRKTGVRWVVPTLMEWYQLRRNMGTQGVYYVQYRSGGVS